MGFVLYETHFIEALNMFRKNILNVFIYLASTLLHTMCFVPFELKNV